MAWTKGQWPHAITTGEIRCEHIEARHGMGEWWCLRDASHGIPVFGSVRSEEGSVEVKIFNYPGQTEEIASELVKRWNEYPKLMAEMDRLSKLVGQVA
ncbi:MAG: hypothetical protein ACRYGG_01045 [Janthinobacterium lividum]